MSIFFALIISFSFYAALGFKFLADPTSPILPYVLNYIFLYKILLVFSCLAYILAILGTFFIEVKGEITALPDAIKTLVKPKFYSKILNLISLSVIFFVGLTGIDWGVFTLLLLCNIEFHTFKWLLIYRLKELNAMPT